MDYFMRNEKIIRRLSVLLQLLCALALVKQARAAEGCGPAIAPAEVTYDANFRWKPVRAPGYRSAEHPALSMRIVMGTPGRLANAPAAAPGREARTVAQIWSPSGCQAVCQLKNVERDAEAGPRAIDLECQSAEFGPMTSHVSIVWKENARTGREPEATLRFGSWVRGYDDAALEVVMDRMPLGQSSRTLASRSGLEGGSSL